MTIRSKPSCPNSPRGSNSRGVGDGEADAALKSRAVAIAAPRRRQHLGGNIEAVEPGLRISLRRPDQVAAGAAADLEHRAARRQASPAISRSRPSR